MTRRQPYRSRSTRKRHPVLLLIVILAAATVAGVNYFSGSSPGEWPGAQPGSQPTAQPAEGTPPVAGPVVPATGLSSAEALVLVAALPDAVYTDDGSYAGNREELFGDAWAYDFDQNGCDTRYDILTRDLVDTDVLLWITGDLRAIEAIKNDPIRQTLRAVADGREIFLDQIEIGAAMSFSSLLSLPYFLDYIEPRLVAAVDGDPATVVGG